MFHATTTPSPHQNPLLITVLFSTFSDNSTLIFPFQDFNTWAKLTSIAILCAAILLVLWEATGRGRHCAIRYDIYKINVFSYNLPSLMGVKKIPQFTTCGLFLEKKDPTCYPSTLVGPDVDSALTTGISRRVWVNVIGSKQQLPFKHAKTEELLPSEQWRLSAP